MVEGIQSFPEKKEIICDFKLQAEGKLRKDKEKTMEELGLAFIRVTDDAKMIVVGEYI